MRLRHTLRTTLAALVIACLTLTTSASAQSRSLRLTEGATATKSGTIEAGAHGARLNLEGSATLVMAPGAVVRRFYSTRNLWLDAAGRTPTYIVTVVDGRVNVEIKSSPRKRAVLINTPNKLTAAIKTGEMVVVVNREHTSIGNLKGDVLVASRGNWSSLPEGKIRTGTQVQAGAFQIQDRYLPTAPKPHLAQRVWFSTTGGVDIDGITLEKARGASAYRVSLQPQGSSGATVVETTTPAAPVAFERVKPGVYTLRSWSVDSDGLKSEQSDPIQLNIVDVAVKPGSHAGADGQIQLSQGHKAELNHTRGLLMAYGKSERWGPVARRVGLYRGGETRVHFKHADGGKPVTLTLSPRTVTANVEIAPRRAMWPRDHIRLRVRVQDGTKTAPAWVKPKIEVRLGLEALSVKWSKRKGAFETQIAPRPGKGPWVLRVRVVDQHGIELGRNFLEIAPAPKAKPKPR